jgi:hypothetical protein
LSLEELATPDLDLIKQGEQGDAGPARAVRQGPVGQSRRPAARLPRPRQPRRPAVAPRGRRGANPQSRRIGARRRRAGWRAVQPEGEISCRISALGTGSGFSRRIDRVVCMISKMPDSSKLASFIPSIRRRLTASCNALPAVASSAFPASTGGSGTHYGTIDRIVERIGEQRRRLFLLRPPWLPDPPFRKRVCARGLRRPNL